MFLKKPMSIVKAALRLDKELAPSSSERETNISFAAVFASMFIASCISVNQPAVVPLYVDDTVACVGEPVQTFLPCCLTKRDNEENA